MSPDKRKLFNISKQGYYYKAKHTGYFYKTILKDLAYQFHKLYKELKLQMRRKTKKRLANIITYDFSKIDK